MKGNEKGGEGKADKAPKEPKPKKKKPVEKSREWEKERREKLNVAFDILSKLLPDSDPTVTMSKIEILTKAAEYIKRLQEQNEEIIKHGNKTSLKNEAERLKKRVAVLLLKTKELVAALRSAGVPLPSNKKRKCMKKTKNVNEVNKENKTGKKVEKAKSDATTAPIVPNAGIVVQAPVVKPMIGGLQPISIDKKVLSRLGPGALILADGRVVNVPPIVPQIVVKPQPTVFVMQRVKKGESPIAPKKRDVTKTTFANKAPIPAIKTFRMESQPRSPKPKKKPKLKNDKEVTPSTSSTEIQQKPQEKTQNVKYTIDSLFNKNDEINKNPSESPPNPITQDKPDSNLKENQEKASSFTTTSNSNQIQEKMTSTSSFISTQSISTPSSYRSETDNSTVTSSFTTLTSITTPSLTNSQDNSSANNSDQIAQNKPTSSFVQNRNSITQDKTPVTSSYVSSDSNFVNRITRTSNYVNDSTINQDKSSSYSSETSFLHNSIEKISTPSYIATVTNSINCITQDKSSSTSSYMSSNNLNNVTQEKLISSSYATVQDKISTSSSRSTNSINHVTQNNSTPISSSYISSVNNNRITQDKLSTPSSSYMSTERHKLISTSISSSYISTSNSISTPSSYICTSNLISTPSSYISTSNLISTPSSYISSNNRITQDKISTPSSYLSTSNLISTPSSYISTSNLISTPSSYISSNNRITQDKISTPSSYLSTEQDKISTPISSSYTSTNNHLQDRAISTISSSYTNNLISTPSSYISSVNNSINITQDKLASTISSSYMTNITQDKPPVTSSYMCTEFNNREKPTSSSFMTGLINHITQNKSSTTSSYIMSSVNLNAQDKSSSYISDLINPRISQDKSTPTSSFMTVNTDFMDTRITQAKSTPISSSFMSTDLISNRITQDKPTSSSNFMNNRITQEKPISVSSSFMSMNSDYTPLITQEKSSFMSSDLINSRITQEKTSFMSADLNRIAQDKIPIPVSSSFMRPVNSIRITQDKSTPFANPDLVSLPDKTPITSSFTNNLIGSQKTVSTSITTNNGFYTSNDLMPTEKIPATSSYMSDLIPQKLISANSDITSTYEVDYNKGDKKRYTSEVYNELHQPQTSTNQMFPIIAGPTFSHDFNQQIQTPQYQNNQIMQNNQRLYQPLVIPENQQFPNQNCDFSRYNFIPNNNFRSTNSTQTPTYKNNQNCDFSIYQNNCDYRAKYKNCDNFSMSNITQFESEKAKEKLYSTNTEGNSFKTDCSDLLRISKEIEKIPIDNSDFSNDLFSSLQVPSGGHSESISPTAAFLLAFPLVSTSKNADNNETENNENQTSTPTTILQIGNIETPTNEMFQPIEFAKDLNTEYLDVNLKCKAKKPTKKYQNYYPEFCDWENKKNKKQEKAKFYECYKNKKNKKITVPWMSETENYREENFTTEVDNIELYNKKGLGFSWSPSKALMPIDSTLMIPTSTLPTLTGDLALGTPDFKKKTPEKDEKRKSQQFLSVSQLVDPKSKKLKPTDRQYKKPEKKRSLNFPKRKDQECMLNENLVPNLNWDKRYKGNYSAESLIAQDETFNYQQNNYFQNTEFVHEGQSQYQSFNFGQNHFSYVPDEYQTDNFSLNNVGARPNEKRVETTRALNQEGVQNNLFQSYYPATTSQSNFVPLTTPSSFGVTTNTTTSLTNFNLSTIFPEMNDQRSAPTGSHHNMNSFNQYRHPV